MSTQTISQAYVLGIQEGRAGLKHALGEGVPRDEYLHAEVRNLRALLAQGFSDDMRDNFKGALDFAINQIKKG